MNVKKKIRKFRKMSSEKKHFPWTDLAVPKVWPKLKMAKKSKKNFFQKEQVPSLNENICMSSVRTSTVCFKCTLLLASIRLNRHRHKRGIIPISSVSLALPTAKYCANIGNFKFYIFAKFFFIFEK